MINDNDVNGIVCLLNSEIPFDVEMGLEAAKLKIECFDDFLKIISKIPDCKKYSVKKKFRKICITSKGKLKRKYKLTLKTRIKNGK